MSPIFHHSKHVNRVDSQSKTMGGAYQHSKLLHQTGYHNLTPYPGAFVVALSGFQEVVDTVAEAIVSPAQQQSFIELMNPIMDVLIV